MPWYVLTIFAGFTVVAQYHVVQALRHREHGDGKPLNEIIAMGILAGRNRFTATGWRHRRLAIIIQLLGFVASVLVWVASGTLS